MRTKITVTVATLGLALFGCSEQSLPDTMSEIDMAQATENTAEMINSGEMAEMMAIAANIQKMGTVNGRQVLVQWQPPQVMEAMTAPMMEKQGIEMPERLDEIMTITVMDMTMMIDPEAEGGLGDDLEERIRIRTPDGTELTPVGTRDISEDMPEDMPEMEGMPFDMSAMMEQMQTFEFPDVVDVTQEGTFTVIIDEVEFVWELPIIALLPKMTCPEDGEEFSGDYKFCPRHSVELN